MNTSDEYEAMVGTDWLTGEPSEYVDCDCPFDMTSHPELYDGWNYAVASVVSTEEDDEEVSCGPSVEERGIQDKGSVDWPTVDRQSGYHCSVASVPCDVGADPMSDFWSDTCLRLDEFTEQGSEVLGSDGVRVCAEQVTRPTEQVGERS